jgi:hypothetical protein
VLSQLSEQFAKAQRLADEEFEAKRLNVCKCAETDIRDDRVFENVAE